MCPYLSHYLHKDRIDIQRIGGIPKQYRFLDADKMLKSRVFAVPENIDELLKSLENPHIPEAERLDKEDDDVVFFKDEETAMDALSIKLGVVPDWLQQRYKSKFPKKKETPEQKELRQKEAAEEASTRKRKAEAEARETLQKIVQDMPPPEASLQDRRDWELKLLQGVHRNPVAPRVEVVDGWMSCQVNMKMKR